MEINRFHKGRAGEDAAADFLARNGMKIVERNFRCPSGEIDIIARDGKTIVFVEVRSTGGTKFGHAEESLIARKRRRVVNAALWYLKKSAREHASARIDVVAIRWNEGKPEINWIVNAFEARS
jgi:putative endonuclease